MDEIVKGLRLIRDGDDLRDLSGKVNDHTYCPCYRCELCGQLIIKDPITCDDIAAKVQGIKEAVQRFGMTTDVDMLHKTPTHVGMVEFCGYKKVLPARKFANE